ncbi:hypothetical protein DID88_000386 [Monilinia fructigena]|uniref:VASt domain-containing protein n=1 Tax=Monilinia fructigena TaxID=38457 RepID=A0A395IHD5_9HELO|nr:hypothetical protein DID88_000386 [Monilinia fructigena]
MSDVVPPIIPQLNKPLSLIPVGLKEAALDSPTFRATAVHFSDQVEILEKWLDAYVKSISKLVYDISSMEEAFNTFLLRSVPPANVSEAVLDHDYTLLAMRRFGEGSKEWWSQIMTGTKRMDANICEPIRSFMASELRNFKDARRYLEQSQKTFDSTLARYVAQSKTKEPSALREDAFQVHETRKAYLKASLDFCLLAPQLRYTIDKLLVRVSSDHWRDMKRSREVSLGTFAKWGNEMDRVRGWSKEMEAGEATFRRELQLARKDIAETASQASKPSRELEDYNLSTVAYLGSRGPSTVNIQPQSKHTERSEKQDWLFLRTVTGKPARTAWVRRWFYVKDGIFGWLVQGIQSGGVEESEKIGVLLCNVKPAVQEDRRFCFEVKTKNQAILVQAETQTLRAGGIDPAFAITPPSIPEFAAKNADGQISYGSEDVIERSGTLPIPGAEFVGRNSSDVITGPRRSVTSREEGETGREHAARIMQKLDLHRKPTNIQANEPPTASQSTTGGIASLISASHTILPISTPSTSTTVTNPLPNPQIILQSPTQDYKPSTLAPATLVSPPAPTNLSKSAVIVSGERGVGVGQGDAGGGMPSGIMANLWGSSNWGYINRLEKGEIKTPSLVSRSAPGSPRIKPLEPSPKIGTDENLRPDTGLGPAKSPISPSTDSLITPVPSFVIHRKSASASIDIDAARTVNQSVFKPEVYPSNYPIELKTQEAQFRMIFPNVPREDKVILVFRATWNPDEQHDFPGRVYVTQKDIYFYSHHLGLVLITGVKLASISEVTAAPEDIMASLIKMEHEDPTRSPSMESWEDVDVNTPVDDGTISGRTHSRKDRDLRASLHVERGLNFNRKGKEVTKFQLPSQPVIYEPPDMQRKTVEREFNISPKALFHLMFGDKSAVFQLLYHERRAQKIAQGPWIHLDSNHMRREFEFQIDYVDSWHKARQTNIIDHQVIDIMNDHVCYVVTDSKTPWHLPHFQDFMLISKIVITHVAKSKCKLAIYTKVEWSKSPKIGKGLVERQALDDCAMDAEDLADVIADQVRKLGPNSRTKKAIHIYGHVGHKTTVSLFSANDANKSKRPQIKQRTLTNMLLETISSFGESVISSVMMWIFAAFRSVWKIFSAHTIILIALLLSILVNAFLTGRDTSEWWMERNAAKFMSRMGVGPNPSMSKAIYLKDLDEAVNSLSTDVQNRHQSKCYIQFMEIANVTDLDAPYEMAGTPFSKTSTKSTAKRLRRTRQNLGSYRHDLMIAMRVVNNIERNVLKAEWRTGS